MQGSNPTHWCHVASIGHLRCLADKAEETRQDKGTVHSARGRHLPVTLRYHANASRVDNGRLSFLLLLLSVFLRSLLDLLLKGRQLHCILPR